MPEAPGIPMYAEPMDVSCWLFVVTQKYNMDFMSFFSQKTRKVEKSAVWPCEQIFSLWMALG